MVILSPKPIPCNGDNNRYNRNKSLEPKELCESYLDIQHMLMKLLKKAISCSKVKHSKTPVTRTLKNNLNLYVGPHTWILQSGISS